jgi:hypothetical protein
MLVQKSPRDNSTLSVGYRQPYERTVKQLRQCQQVAFVCFAVGRICKMRLPKIFLQWRKWEYAKVFPAQANLTGSSLAIVLYTSNLPDQHNAPVLPASPGVPGLKLQFLGFRQFQNTFGTTQPRIASCRCENLN